MRNRIQKSMIFVVTMSLLISYILVTLVIYRQALDIRRSELVQEAEYIRAAIDISGEEYFGTMDKVSRRTRVTWIDKDGKVLYDTGNDQETLANHKSRKEFKEALANGSGQDIRMSDSKGQEMYYYALKMDDSSVLRVSRGMDTVWNTAFMILPYMIAIGVMMGCVAWFMTRHQVKRLIAPINNLDLEEPLENDVYEELHPLLERIDRQNKEKAAIEQMRREFSANVSHELKTPLAIISVNAEAIEMVNGKNDWTEGILKQVRHLSNLINHLILLSKASEMSRLQLKIEPLDVKKLLSAAASEFDLLVKDGGKKLAVSCPEGLKGMSDWKCMNELIHIFLDNAVKYCDKGGTISVSAAGTKKNVTVSVTNDYKEGGGVDYSRFFERFYRNDESHNSEKAGYGIGLSIAGELSSLLQAPLSVSYKDGKITFSITMKAG